MFDYVAGHPNILQASVIFLLKCRRTLIPAPPGEPPVQLPVVEILGGRRETPMAAQNQGDASSSTSPPPSPSAF